MTTHYVTSESVTEGHPDKLCDQISDAILDACLAQDPRSHVAVETMASKNTVMIAGEITTKARIDAEAIAREVMREIGYTSQEAGIDADRCLVLTNLNVQSADIAMGVNRSADGMEVIGGGDQGIMYGYAVRETAHLMPKTIELAHGLVRQLAEVRKDGTVPGLYPDGKAQVTMSYAEDGTPVSVESVVVSAQHEESVNPQNLREALIRKVILPVVPEAELLPPEKIFINPTGRFVIGGPMGDTGLTGRKIMVDTYGGIGKHGGGAFSGKDPSKVDRSAAYMARYAAKNIVAAGLAERCEVAIAYVIGQIRPEAVTVETFGTEHLDRRIIENIVTEVFDFSVAGMIRKLDLRRPQYRKTAAYGHFGRSEEFGWEKTDLAEVLRRKALGELYGGFLRKGVQK